MARAAVQTQASPWGAKPNPRVPYGPSQACQPSRPTLFSQKAMSVVALTRRGSFEEPFDGLFGAVTVVAEWSSGVCLPPYV